MDFTNKYLLVSNSIILGTILCSLFTLLFFGIEYSTILWLFIIIILLCIVIGLSWNERFEE